MLRLCHQGLSITHLPDDLALAHGLRGLDVGQRVPQ